MRFVRKKYWSNLLFFTIFIYNNNNNVNIYFNIVKRTVAGSAERYNGVQREQMLKHLTEQQDREELLEL